MSIVVLLIAAQSCITNMSFVSEQINCDTFRQQIFSAEKMRLQAMKRHRRILNCNY